MDQARHFDSAKLEISLRTGNEKSHHRFLKSDYNNNKGARNVALQPIYVP